ncbi:hypothetical protein E1264_29080 [Actinomadura sp. KC216]|uniref:hypothetical protein n=1 Tax=Actinomadura sp. KC216 TaxID=2530370 RepID=UPI00104A4075|nr:hypothetical protein [Actinomadura sp. KC216]TDB83267.1 hypothetical protein E1264_29080 [Actinomadura sp. KC216]
MSVYGYEQAPYGESESYEAEEEFGVGSELYGESGLYETEAEFGTAAEQWESEAEFGTAAEQSVAETFSGTAQESPLSEAEELQLATELLEISGEEELEQFLGKMFRNVSRGVGGFLRSSVGRNLGGVLKNVAKAALPIAGGALGSMIPGGGTVLGTKLGTLAAKMFELESEGLDREDQELEVARRFVRLAATAARNAALGPRRAPAGATARRAVLTAARRHAPGVVRRYRAFAVPAPWYWPAPFPAYPYAAYPEPGAVPTGQSEFEFESEGDLSEAAVPGMAAPGPRQSGRWVRRGRKIVLLGI